MKTKKLTFSGLMGGTGFWTFLRMSKNQKPRIDPQNTWKKKHL